MHASASCRPVTLAALAQIGGVGGGKLARYGADIIGTVREAG